ncbi:TPA: hypothetical protein ACGPOM_002393 [Yersinia enterocolitica]
MENWFFTHKFDDSYIFSNTVDSVTVYFDISIPRECQEPSNFHVHEFCGNYKESDLKKINHKKNNSKRNVGYLIPALYLAGEEHHYDTDDGDFEYLSCYIDSVIKNMVPSLLKRYKNKINDTSINNEFHIRDLIEDKQIFVCLTNDGNRFMNDFNFKDYYIQFYSAGIIPLKNGISPPHDSIMSHIVIPKNSITIIKINEEISSNNFIKHILTESLPYEEKPLFVFFNLYQIVELLMEKVLTNEYSSVISKLVASNNGNASSHELKVLQGELSELTNEKKRLNKLVGEYCNFNEIDSIENMHEINSFLHSVGKNNEDLVINGIYTARNIIFHSYRSISNPQLIASVNKVFNTIVVSMLLSYKPKQMSEA